MSRLFIIIDNRGSRLLSDNDLPLTAGSDPDGHIFLQTGQETEGYIGDASGHLFFQPATASSSIYHNDQHLADSVWIKSGDITRIGSYLLHYDISGDRVEIRISSEAEKTEPSPPGTQHPETLPPNKKLPRSPAAEKKQHRFRSRLMQLAAGIFLVLLVASFFVLTAKPLEVRISPEPDSISITGFPPVIKLGNRYLGMKGGYGLKAEKKGYRTLEEPITISSGQRENNYAFSLAKLPGIVSFFISPVEEAEVFINDISVGTTPLEKIEIPAGEQTIRVINKRYQDVEQAVTIKGQGLEQRFDFILSPAWAIVDFTSEPSGAEVVINNQVRGTTPLSLDILEGTYPLTFQKNDFSPLTMELEVTAGEELSATVTLTPLPANLELKSAPSGATVMVDGLFQGQTPFTLELSSLNAHALDLSLPGFENLQQKIILAPGEEKTMTLKMTPEYGIIFLTTIPSDADLFIDGRPHGKATGRLKLTVQKHILEIRAKGYRTATRTVLPKKEYSRQVEIQLESEKKPIAQPVTSGKQTLKKGPKMILLQPASFAMGTSRREPGRRANERLRQVKITRPYYVSTREVTNAEFHRFKPNHSSGTLAGFSLDNEKQPVVNVSWEDAVQYLNWLSSRDGLEPFYQEENGEFIPKKPLTTGYRLPFESEWAYAARYAGNSKPTRYPWTGPFPPTNVSGNFADESSQGLLTIVIRGYNDSFPVTAPVASFPRNMGGFFDLGGNASEWCHDLYTPYIGFSGETIKDPMGPDTGVHHVLRGSSWRDGSITELRLTYRSYSNKARDDTGFRIARFAQ